MPGLIPRPAALWLAVAPVAMRWGADGLSLYVQQVLRADPCAGSAYLFRNKRGNRIKLRLWDGTGVWLCQRRLHRGHFVWPRPGDSRFAVTLEQWQWLIAGVDWQRLAAAPIQPVRGSEKGPFNALSPSNDGGFRGMTMV